MHSWLGGLVGGGVRNEKKLKIKILNNNKKKNQKINGGGGGRREGIKWEPKMVFPILQAAGSQSKTWFVYYYFVILEMIKGT